MGDFARAFPSSAARAWAPCARRSCTLSACAASAEFSRRSATASLEDDDEVAVLHGPAELGYLAASEAMVNIRATLALAQMKGVLEPGSRRSLENLAKSVFFGERNWPELLAAAASKGIAEAELVALQDWLPEGRVDRKRLDALAMLAAMQEAITADAPMVPSFHFEWTFLWDQFVARCADDTGASPVGAARSR